MVQNYLQFPGRGYQGLEPLTMVNGIDFSPYFNVSGPTSMAAMSDGGGADPGAVDPVRPDAPPQDLTPRGGDNTVAVDPIRPDDPNPTGEGPKTGVDVQAPLADATRPDDLPGIGPGLRAALEAQFGTWPPPLSWLQAFAPHLIGVVPSTTVPGTTGPTTVVPSTVAPLPVVPDTPGAGPTGPDAPAPTTAAPDPRANYRIPSNTRLYLSPQTRNLLYGEERAPPWRGRVDPWLGRAGNEFP